MDDPWGSPWADELRHEVPIPKLVTDTKLGKVKDGVDWEAAISRG